jgi:hypothetical protein
MTNKFIYKHVSKSFKFDPKRTNPIDVAVEDTREFFVDHIVGHTGDAKKDMMFKVRWQGYTSADDTWEELTLASSRREHIFTPILTS